MAARLQEFLNGEISDKWTWRKRCVAAEHALEDRRSDQRFTAASRVLAQLAVTEGGTPDADVLVAIDYADKLMAALYPPPASRVSPPMPRVANTNPLEAAKQ